MPMEVTNIVSVVDLRNKIYEEHGQIDILINNAGMYFYPALDATEHFVQVQRTLDINYWGLKNVINAFLPMMSDTARIVNMNSNYGHVSHIPTRRIKQKLGKIAIISRMNIVKLREREGQGVDLGRSLKGNLWMVDGGWWYPFPRALH